MTTPDAIDFNLYMVRCFDAAALKSSPGWHKLLIQGACLWWAQRGGFRGRANAKGRAASAFR